MQTRQALLRSATDLVEEGTRNDLIPAGLEEEVWSAVTTAVTHPIAWDEEEEDFQSFGNLLTAALNRTASRAIEAALHAGLWSYRLRAGTDTGEASRVAEEHLAPILNEIFQRTGSGRVAAEAMVGQFLSQLKLIAPEWIEEHLAELLDSGAVEPLAHPAWGGYLTRSRFYDSVFKALRPWYVGAAEAATATSTKVTSDGGDWSLTESLADHVMTAVLRGQAAVGDPDELVEKTFANVPVAERGHAYWGVFRGWSDTEEAPPQAFIERLLAFWEWRLNSIERIKDSAEAVEEAQGLGWFLRTPYLPATEVLRLGVRTAKAAEGKLEIHSDWARLRDLAATDVDAAYDIAELVLESQLSEAHHYVRVDDVKALLRIVLDEGEPETRSRARRLVNRLGEAGYEDFHDISE